MDWHNPDCVRLRARPITDYLVPTHLVFGHPCKCNTISIRGESRSDKDEIAVSIF